MKALALSRVHAFARLGVSALILFGAVACATPERASPAPEQASADPISALVRIRAHILPNARTAQSLGIMREGTGVMIDHTGIVLTIGYLVLEASGIELMDATGRTVPARLIGYDFGTGFAILRPALPLAVKPIELGDSSTLSESDLVMVATRNAISLAYVTSRRIFAGYWEYLLEDAIFTAPPRADFGGAALIGRDGRLLGIGSLFVGDAAAPQTRSPGNMFVPINAVKPILPDLIANGRPRAPAQPWLGLNLLEFDGQVLVTRVSPESPAERVGVRVGDMIVAVGSDSVSDLADLYRKVWARGAAGTQVPLKLLRESRLWEVVVPTMDRGQYLRSNPTY